MKNSGIVVLVSGIVVLVPKSRIFWEIEMVFQIFPTVFKNTEETRFTTTINIH